MLTFEPLKNDIAVAGTGQCVTDLNRLGAVLKLYPDPPGPDALNGRGAGPLWFRYAGDVTTFGGALDVTNFTFGPKDKQAGPDLALHLEVDGSYTDSTDAVALTVAKVERAGLAIEAKGAVTKATTAQDVNVTGTVRLRLGAARAAGAHVDRWELRRDRFRNAPLHDPGPTHPTRRAKCCDSSAGTEGRSHRAQTTRRARRQIRPSYPPDRARLPR